MRNFLLLIVGALLIGACAIPLPLQIASWALDGISMLATKKSVADHGLSILAQNIVYTDCFRGNYSCFDLRNTVPQAKTKAIAPGDSDSGNHVWYFPLYFPGSRMVLPPVPTHFIHAPSCRIMAAIL